MTRRLLTPGAHNAKTAKGAEGLESAIMHLAPVDIAYPGRSVCPWATAGCAAACLNTSGRGQVRGELTAERLETNPIHRARIRRTRLFFDDRREFLRRLEREVAALVRRAKRRGKVPAVRLNGTSDLPWEKIAPELFSRFPEVHFYDYTKSAQRARQYARGELPSNYHLTYSRSERAGDDKLAESLLSEGANVAVVFAGSKLPERWYGRPVIDGLEHDYRFKDPRGVVVGLLAKGRGKRDASGFVVRQQED